MKTILTIFTVLLTTWFLSLSAQTIYVDASNNTGVEDGTQQHPFNTITEGLFIAQNGDAISVAPGTYLEDTLLIEHCVSITGDNRSSTIVEGAFVLSSRLDTMPVSISNLWCRNVMHSDSGFTQTPLTIQECGLQTLTDVTPMVYETGRKRIKNNIVTDSIHLFSASCKAICEILNCESGGGIRVRNYSMKEQIHILENQINGSLIVETVAKSDTLFVTENTIQDSLIVVSVSSDYDVISENSIGDGMRLNATVHLGFQFTDNQVQHGSLLAFYKALSTSEIKNNAFLNGGIKLRATSAQIKITGNEIQTDGTESGIRLNIKAGGEINDNTITLPYLPASGVPFEADTNAICGIFVNSTSFTGMAGNHVMGGSYAVYLKSVASHSTVNNTIEDAHFGLYIATVSGDVDNNRVEECIADGMILNYFTEYSDTNSISINHNVVRNNGGNGIWVKGNALMGKQSETGSGYNTIKDNDGYDLYIETPATLFDTIWAQNNHWTHSSESEVELHDIYDASDNPSKSLVMFSPVLPSGTGEIEGVVFKIYPNPAKTSISLQSLPKAFGISQQSAVVEIFDLHGKKLLEKHIPKGIGKIELDVSHLQSGMYFCRITAKYLSSTKKIIIQR